MSKHKPNWKYYITYFTTLSAQQRRKLSNTNFGFIWLKLTAKQRNLVVQQCLTSIAEDALCFTSTHKVLQTFLHSAWRSEPYASKATLYHYDRTALLLWSKMVKLAKERLDASQTQAPSEDHAKDTTL